MIAIATLVLVTLVIPAIDDAKNRTATREQRARERARLAAGALDGPIREVRYAWCEENSPPGEGASGTSVFVPPATACAT